jgi:hypothetical protein
MNTLLDPLPLMPEEAFPACDFQLMLWRAQLDWKNRFGWFPPINQDFQRFIQPLPFGDPSIPPII